MQLGDVIRRLTAAAGRGNVVKDVNTAVATNVDDPAGSVSEASSHRRTHIVQRDGRTTVHESEESTTERRT
jgi:hypothetical protein